MFPAWGLPICIITALVYAMRICVYTYCIYARAAKLARRLAERKGISMTEAVIDALESALLRGERPLAERLAEIAADARRLGDPRRRRPMTAQDADALWGRP
jgi:antitoxin VapB